MQSIKRQLKRGSAVIVIDETTGRKELIRRRGSTKKEWRRFVNGKRFNELNKQNDEKGND